MHRQRPVLVHDTQRILDANEAACALFRCDVVQLVDQDLLGLIVSADFKELARIHMRVLRDQGNAPNVEYPFLRCDLSVFWAQTTSECFGEEIFSMELKHVFEEY